MVVMFLNINNKMEVKFQSILGLFALQQQFASGSTIEAFTLTKRRRSFSDLLNLNVNDKAQLQRHLKSKKITIEIEGRFKVKAHVGFLHYSYYLLENCKLELSSPPNGKMVSSNCTTTQQSEETALMCYFSSQMSFLMYSFMKISTSYFLM